jgi:large subunit ribosomal protein L24
MLKGPLDMPRRNIDVGPFASWLALRAVEQQSKKLDVLEGREPSQPPNVDQAPAESVIQRTPVPPAPRGQNGSDALQQRSILRNRPNGSTAKPAPGDAVQPLPPPIDIRPAPGSRPSRAQPGVVGQQNKPPPPTVTRPRSLSEILFGH